MSRPLPRSRHLELVGSTPLSDAQLLALGKEGASGFPARAYDRFAPDINRIIFRLLGPDPDHDDLVHDTFVELLRKVHQVRDPEKLSSWVLTIAVNIVYRELRRRKRRRWFGALPRRDSDEVDAGPDHEARELLRAVYGALDQLPISERQVFALRHLSGRPMVEVAELCQCSLSSAKRLLHKAEQRFETVAARLQPELLGLLSREKPR
jgi:RNA polymerase sigma-70 factor (ECF subfamily)